MLTAKAFTVSDQEKETTIRNYLAEEIPKYLPQSHPHVFFIGGQPASGKSNLITHLRKEFGGAFAIDSDVLRQHHPQIDEIITHDPLRMDVLSNEPIGYWFKTCIEAAKEHRFNIIIENSFTQSQVLIKEAEHFLDAGYTVNFTAIITPEEISRLGIINRYKDAVEQNRLPRWTTSNAHDNAYQKMPSVIAEILDSQTADTILLASRDKSITRIVSNPHDVEPAITEIRNQVLTNHPLDTWAQTYAKCITFLHDHNLITNYTQPLLTKLHHDAEKLLTKLQQSPPLTTPVRHTEQKKTRVAIDLLEEGDLTFHYDQPTTTTQNHDAHNQQALWVAPEKTHERELARIFHGVGFGGGGLGLCGLGLVGSPSP